MLMSYVYFFIVFLFTSPVRFQTSLPFSNIFKYVFLHTFFDYFNPFPRSISIGDSSVPVCIDYFKFIVINSPFFLPHFHFIIAP